MTTTTDDTLIALYIEAAEEHIADFLNDPNYNYAAPIKAAALLIVGGLYENRESQGEKQIYENPAVKALLWPYRKELGL